MTQFSDPKFIGTSMLIGEEAVGILKDGKLVEILPYKEHCVDDIIDRFNIHSISQPKEK